jgi:hypothetical protein
MEAETRPLHWGTSQGDLYRRNKPSKPTEKKSIKRLTSVTVKRKRFEFILGKNGCNHAKEC